jgi:cellulose synthase/poly-beta-1,6-N-acetylglucosamine synthase-like glycosyltransferase
MAPAELEIYHQIKNVIGVNPSFYEYLLAVDADTTVHPEGLNYLVAGFVEDRKSAFHSPLPSLLRSTDSLVPQSSVSAEKRPSPTLALPGRR